MECVLLYWHLHRNHYENEHVIGKKIENIEGFLDYMKNFHKSIVNE